VLSDIDRLRARVHQVQRLRLILVASLTFVFALLLWRMVQHGLCDAEALNGSGKKGMAANDSEPPKQDRRLASALDPKQLSVACFEEPPVERQVDACAALELAVGKEIEQKKREAKLKAIECVVEKSSGGGMQAAQLAKDCAYHGSSDAFAEIASLGQDALTLHAVAVRASNRIQLLGGVRAPVVRQHWCSIGAAISPVDGDGTILGKSRAETFGLVSLLLTVIALLALLAVRLGQASAVHRRLLQLRKEPGVNVPSLGSGDTEAALECLEDLARDTPALKPRVMRFRQHLRHSTRSQQLAEQLLFDPCAANQEEFQFHRARLAELEALDDELHPIPSQIRRDGDGPVGVGRILLGLAFASTVSALALLIVSVGISDPAFTATAAMAAGCASAAYALLGRQSNDEADVLESLKMVSSAKKYLDLSSP